MSAAEPSVDSGPLSPPDVAAVLALAERAEAADGVAALSEHAQLHLRRGGGADLVARAVDGLVIGFAHRDGGDAELVVDPDHRRHGVGTALVAALGSAASDPAHPDRDEVGDDGGGGGCRVWAHGNRPPAVAFAERLGYSPVRELWQMGRPLRGSDASALPDLEPPEGLRLRGFRVCEDEDSWLRVNAAAFAHHPEQGGWTRTDLEEREATEWFDPDGLIVAEKADGSMAGFHWTKVHSPQLGEVYVLAVDPASQGMGLGPLLTVAGLRHLADQGLGSVMLYVDGDNAPAISTYRGLGFERIALDVMYAPTQSSPDGATIDG